MNNNQNLQDVIWENLPVGSYSDADRQAAFEALTAKRLTPEDIKSLPGHIVGFVRKQIRTRDFFDDRNVRDKYKGLTHEEIVKDLDLNGGDLVCAASNSIHDFNLATVVRNCNALGVRDLILTGSRSVDRRGAVGADKYMDITMMDSLADVISTYRDRGYTIVAAEYDERYLDKSVELDSYVWDRQSVVLFGEEGITLPDEILEAVDAIVYIDMVGSVRSLNVGVTSGIFFNHYSHNHRKMF